MLSTVNLGVFLCVALLPGAPTFGRSVQDDGARGAGSELLAVTWNLRYPARDAYPWREERLELTVELWRARDPDLVGTQEGVWSQLTDLQRELPEWGWIGFGRDGGSRGEHNAIFYRRARFEVLEHDHFWLSATPRTIGSRSFGNGIPRMATWVRLEDRDSGAELVVWNTHFDHQSDPARLRSAELIGERLAAVAPAARLIVLGDFNAPAVSSEPYELLRSSADLKDAWLLAPQRGPDVGTFHGYHGPMADTPRIDWVLCRGPLRPLEASIWTFGRDGRYPSDHFPVGVRFALGE